MQNQEKINKNQKKWIKVINFQLKKSIYLFGYCPHFINRGIAPFKALKRSSSPVRGVMI